MRCSSIVARAYRYHAMKALCQLCVWVLLATLALAILGTAVGIGAGALLARWLPLSLFQASALAIGATVAVTLVVHVVTTMVPCSDGTHRARENNHERTGMVRVMLC